MNLEEKIEWQIDRFCKWYSIKQNFVFLNRIILLLMFIFLIIGIASEALENDRLNSEIKELQIEIKELRTYGNGC